MKENRVETKALLHLLAVRHPSLVVLVRRLIVQKKSERNTYLTIHTDRLGEVRDVPESAVGGTLSNYQLFGMESDAWDTIDFELPTDDPEFIRTICQWVNMQ